VPCLFVAHMQTKDNEETSLAGLDSLTKRRRISNERLIAAERPDEEAAKNAKRSRSILNESDAAKAMLAKVEQVVSDTAGEQEKKALDEQLETVTQDESEEYEQESIRTKQAALQRTGDGKYGYGGQKRKRSHLLEGNGAKRVGIAKNKSRKLRQEAEATAASLRITSLWDWRGPLRKTQYFWPRCNAEEHDQSLVRLDWILDYLNNMLLIVDTPTTLARHKLLLNYEKEAGHYRREFSLLERVSTDDPSAVDINVNTVECNDEPYEFSIGKFSAAPKQSTHIREELKPLQTNISAIKAMPMRNGRRVRASKDLLNDATSCCTLSEDDDTDAEDKRHSGAADNAWQNGNSMKVGAVRLSGEQLARALGLDRGQYTPMLITQYEIDHPHNMSPLHQRLFIGQLNGFMLKHTPGQLSELTIVDVAPKVFGLDPDNVSAWSPEYIVALARQMSAYITMLLMRLKRKGHELKHVYGEQFALRLRKCFYSNRLRKIQYQVQTMMRHLLVMASAFQRNNKPTIPERPTLLTLSVLAPALTDADLYEDMNAMQRTVRRLLEECQDNGYRRRDGRIYKQVYCNGYRTNAFVPYKAEKSDIEDFVWRSPDMNMQTSLWLDHSKTGNLCSNVIHYLKNVNAPEFFPDLQRLQYVWSFRNGIYDGRQDRFWAYDSAEIHEDAASPYFGSECSARFIDIEFDADHLMSQDTKQNPRLIRVDPMERIFDSQHLSQEVRDWAWGFTGRLYFPVRLLDNWQVVFWLRGVAGTGKSTYAHAIEAPYEAGDLGFIQNNIEEKFGLEPLVDRFLIVAPEVKANFSLDAAVFQLLAAGDEVSVARKGRSAVQIPAWKVPQLYVSNVVPRWIDSSGSIQRRIMCLMFECVVPEEQKDTTLEETLKQQLDALIVRACRSYHKIRKVIGNDDVWRHVPEAFKLARDDVRNETTGLARFFGEVLVVTDNPDDYVDIDDLQTLHQFQNRDPNGASQKVVDAFAKQLRRDLPSFHNLRVEQLDQLTRTSVVRRCRLHLPKARQIRANQEWLPDVSKYCTREDLEKMAMREDSNLASQPKENDKLSLTSVIKAAEQRLKTSGSLHE